MSPANPARILLPRGGGVLLHVTSLPGSGHIGDLGPTAHHWLEWLSAAGCSAWQMLPLGPTGPGHSPYQALSSFAGNPLLISPELLVEEGLLSDEDVAAEPSPVDSRVDYERAAAERGALLAAAYHEYSQASPRTLQAEFARFTDENEDWLEDFVSYKVIRREQGGAPWYEWPEPLRRRDRGAVDAILDGKSQRLEALRFAQFLFDRQWRALRERARKLGIRLIGDLPIFVALDSADVWAYQELFQLDEEGHPPVVAGVPPDYFSGTGQLWGNPLYRWDRMASNEFAWWVARVARTHERVDLLRLDHFRGFEAHWEIPADAQSAEAGRWVKGPGGDLLRTLRDSLGELPIIAEDLGLITPEVDQLRNEFDLPGMKVLQFAFSGSPSNPYLPHRYERNCVVYTGTHDNDTTRGWYEAAGDGERDFCRRYLAVGGEDIAWDLVRAAWRSVADMAIAPLQDLLSLGTEARMNVPGQPEGHWRWRAPRGALTERLAARLRELNLLYGRTTR